MFWIRNENKINPLEATLETSKHDTGETRRGCKVKYTLQVKEINIFLASARKRQVINVLFHGETVRRRQNREKFRGKISL